ncbi:unnamed protein product, partial [Laminaria digitata]
FDAGFFLGRLFNADPHRFGSVDQGLAKQRASRRQEGGVKQKKHVGQLRGGEKQRVAQPRANGDRAEKDQCLDGWWWRLASVVLLQCSAGTDGSQAVVFVLESALLITR